jgi:CBS domain-containing protein
MATTVSAVLKQKGYEVTTIAPHRSVASLATLLTTKRIGAAPVIDERGRLVGIVSERDIVRCIAERGGAAMEMPVERLMTREVSTCAPEDAVVELMEVMTMQRIRHLPVVHDGALLGIISIGDVVKQRLHEAQSELESLREYISSAS